MITPAFSPTATERVLPKLALDFTTASLDPRVTVTRALNTATRINSSGLVATVNANLPRFDYDPSTLVCKGLLIEEARSNVILYSEDFSNGNWARTGATVSANAAVAPDGNTTGDALVEDGTTGLHIIQQFFTFTTGTAYSFSVFIKPGIRTWVQIFLPTAAFGAAQGGYFNLSGAGSLGNATGTPTSRTITALPNGWYRCTITATSTASAGGNVGITAASANGTNSYAGSNGSTALTLWGADLEVGAFSTSYIANLATGSTTRNADVVAMTGTNFSDWYNASEGSFTVQFDSVAVSATDTKLYYALGASNGTASNLNGVYTYQAAAYGATVNGGAGQANISAGAVTVNTTQKVCYGYKANSFAVSLNGAVANLDGSGTIPTVDRLSIGSLYGSTNVLNGHVAKLAFYTPRLINAEIRAFSK